MEFVYFCKKKGMSVFVPKLTQKEGEFEIVPFRFPLQKGRFNLLEPKNSAFYKNNIDMAVIPVLGVDCEGKRIGFGKGYYDRFFHKLLHKPYIIFISRFFVYVGRGICNQYDVSGDMILSYQLQIRRKKRGMAMDRPYHLGDCRDFDCDMD